MCKVKQYFIDFKMVHGYFSTKAVLKFKNTMLLT